MKYILLLSVAILIFGCDVIELDEVYEENTVVIDTANTSNDTLPLQTNRKAFLEYYTGHLCGNCPGKGGDVIRDLKNVYGDNLVVMSIHAGFFARNNPSGSSFVTDYRTTTGNDLDATYNVTVTGTPKGVVNRSEFQNTYIQTPTNWGTVISTTIGEMTNNVLQSQLTKKNESTVSFELQYRLQNDVQLQFYAIEDSIIDWQRDYDLTPQDIDNYAHRYVLRDQISNNASLSSTGSISFDYSVDAAWNIDKIHIVTLVTQDNEVIQVDMTK